MTIFAFLSHFEILTSHLRFGFRVAVIKEEHPLHNFDIPSWQVCLGTFPCVRGDLLRRGIYILPFGIVSLKSWDGVSLCLTSSFFLVTLEIPFYLVLCLFFPLASPIKEQISWLSCTYNDLQRSSRTCDPFAAYVSWTRHKGDRKLEMERWGEFLLECCQVCWVADPVLFSVSCSLLSLL